MTARSIRGAQCGFTLLEVMIALLVVSVGLLGLAKMQAVAISNTQISSVRSLLSFQAGSLAASMRANRAFWAAGDSQVAFTTSDGAVSDANHQLDTAPKDCDASCTSAQLAAYDVGQWATGLKTRFPNATSNVACSKAATSTPVGCTIAISWQEKYVAINAATVANTSAPTTQQTLMLHVMP